MVNNLHANAEDHKRHGEDPLEEGMATHPSIVAGEIPWTEEPDRLWSIGSQKIRHSLAHTHMHAQFS